MKTFYKLLIYTFMTVNFILFIKWHNDPQKSYIAIICLVLWFIIPVITVIMDFIRKFK